MGLLYPLNPQNEERVFIRGNEYEYSEPTRSWRLIPNHTNRKPSGFSTTGLAVPINTEARYTRLSESEYTFPELPTDNPNVGRLYRQIYDTHIYIAGYSRGFPDRDLKGPTGEDLPLGGDAGNFLVSSIGDFSPISLEPGYSYIGGRQLELDGNASNVTGSSVRQVRVSTPSALHEYIFTGDTNGIIPSLQPSSTSQFILDPQLDGDEDGNIFWTSIEGETITRNVRQSEDPNDLEQMIDTNTISMVTGLVDSGLVYTQLPLNLFRRLNNRGELFELMVDFQDLTIPASGNVSLDIVAIPVGSTSEISLFSQTGITIADRYSYTFGLANALLLDSVDYNFEFRITSSEIGTNMELASVTLAGVEHAVISGGTHTYSPEGIQVQDNLVVLPRVTTNDTLDVDLQITFTYTPTEVNDFEYLFYRDLGFYVFTRGNRLAIYTGRSAVFHSTDLVAGTTYNLRFVKEGASATFTIDGVANTNINIYWASLGIGIQTPVLNGRMRQVLPEGTLAGDAVIVVNSSLRTARTEDVSSTANPLSPSAKVIGIVESYDITTRLANIALLGSVMTFSARENTNYYLGADLTLTTSPIGRLVGVGVSTSEIYLFNDLEDVIIPSIKTEELDTQP